MMDVGSLPHTTRNRELLFNIMTIKYGVTAGDAMHEKTTIYYPPSLSSWSRL